MKNAITQGISFNKTRQSECNLDGYSYASLDEAIDHERQRWARRDRDSFLANFKQFKEGWFEYCGFRVHRNMVSVTYRGTKLPSEQCRFTFWEGFKLLDGLDVLKELIRTGFSSYAEVSERLSRLSWTDHEYLQNDSIGVGFRRINKRLFFDVCVDGVFTGVYKAPSVEELQKFVNIS